MQKDKLILYFNMFLSAIGSVIILLVSIMYTIKENISIGYLNALGFFLIITYTNYLEKKAGISTKLIWIKAIVSMILFASFSYFLYL